MNSPAAGAGAVKVTALIVAYNHEPYIAAAVDSALAQDVDFGYEVLVVEDCSTDRTRAIVSDLAARHGERLRLSLAPRNLGNNAGILRGIREARGEYIALLDGDDYWSSRQKVRKQARFLEQRPDHTMCFHAAATRSQDGTIGRFPAPLSRRSLTAEGLLRGHLVATCSVMFRRAAAVELPPWYGECVFEDWPLYVILAERGKIGYLPEEMSVYRIHGAGAWSGLDNRRKLDQVSRFYDQMSQWMGERYAGAIRQGRGRCEYALARLAAQEGDLAEARRIARAALRQDPWNLRLRLLLHTPSVHHALMRLKERWRPGALS